VTTIFLIPGPGFVAPWPSGWPHHRNRLPRTQWLQQCPNPRPPAERWPQEIVCISTWSISNATTMSEDWNKQNVSICVPSVQNGIVQSYVIFCFIIKEVVFFLLCVFLMTSILCYNVLFLQILIWCQFWFIILSHKFFTIIVKSIFKTPDNVKHFWFPALVKRRCAQSPARQREPSQ